ncbi:ribonuclease [Bacillaceae bacterium SIJ1]|uniref:YlzJ-like family protein n=1 Tax=Litoribacterium kuwaitense TaxID=1398745 RepID=UPI0013ED395F|nr:YlzJ-like family protein [Litoribacterium kuwaitense]NGP44074.1 ribonuclease [Litoribacterium kuwaitense]
MILYTATPPEMIFQSDAQEFQKRKTVQWENCSLLVEETEEQNYRVVQVLSSDPKHYIDQQIAPGQILPFLPKS